MTEPVCTVEAKYFRGSPPYDIVLQVMYYTDERHARGCGPFFRIGRVWTRKAAEAEVAEANRRLGSSRDEIERLTETMKER